jgi:hypothetical protein
VSCTDKSGKNKYSGGGHAGSCISIDDIRITNNMALELSMAPLASLPIFESSFSSSLVGCRFSNFPHDFPRRVLGYREQSIRQ